MAGNLLKTLLFSLNWPEQGADAAAIRGLLDAAADLQFLAPNTVSHWFTDGSSLWSPTIFCIRYAKTANSLLGDPAHLAQ